MSYKSYVTRAKVLDAVTDRPEPVDEIAERAGVSASTAHRYLEEVYLDKEARASYRLRATSVYGRRRDRSAYWRASDRQVEVEVAERGLRDALNDRLKLTGTIYEQTRYDVSADNFSDRSVRVPLPNLLAALGIDMPPVLTESTDG